MIGLAGVACPSATACIASGTYRAAYGIEGLLLTGHGSSWTATRAPAPESGPKVTLGLASAKSCPSAAVCFVPGESRGPAGHVRAIIETGRRSSWSVALAPLPADAGTGPRTHSVLGAVTCPSATRCYAFGNYHDTSGHLEGFVVIWNGSSWTAAQAPMPPGAAASPSPAWAATSCPAADTCVTAANYTDSAGHRDAALLVLSPGP